MLFETLNILAKKVDVLVVLSIVPLIFYLLLVAHVDRDRWEGKKIPFLMYQLLLAGLRN